MYLACLRCRPQVKVIYAIVPFVFGVVCGDVVFYVFLSDSTQSIMIGLRVGLVGLRGPSAVTAQVHASEAYPFMKFMLAPVYGGR